MYLDTVREIIHNLGINEDVTDRSLLRDELGMDSQEIIELSTELERRLNVTLPNRSDVIDELRSVADVVLLLERAQRLGAEAVS